MNRFKLWRRLIGGTWGKDRGTWHRADRRGWLIAPMRLHLRCCEAEERYS